MSTLTAALLTRISLHACSAGELIISLTVNFDTIEHKPVR